VIRRIFTAYTAEVAKAMRRRWSIMGILLVAVAAVACAFIRPAGNGAGAYEYIAYTMSTSLNLLGLFMLLTFCSGLVAAELGNGSICMTLVRPLRRHELLAAKLITGMTYAVLLSAAAGGVSWGIAALTGTLTGVSFGGELLFTNLDMAACFAAGAGLALLSHFAVVAYAVCISTCTRSAGAATGAAIGIWLLADLAKHPLRVGALWFSTYLDTPWQVFADRCSGIESAWLPETAYMVAVSIAWGVLFSALAMAVLARRNLQV